MPEIIPIRDLKNTNAISQRCHETAEPIFVTKNGYGDMVIMSMEAYEHQQIMNEVYAKLATAEAQHEAGMGRPLADILKKRARSMRYNVVLLPAAEDDYQEILRYFERQFDSQQAIRSFVKDFGEVLLRLEETPTIYGYSRDEVLRQREYRKFLIGRYVALFKIDELRNTVEIYRIFHGTQNYTKYL